MHYVDYVLDDDVDQRLAAWLRRELATASAFTLRTGFYSNSALEFVAEDLEAMLARGGEFLAVLGGDLLQVDVEALRALLDLCRRHPENARAVVISESAFQNAKTYHLTHPDERSTAWVGSANYTLGGMAENLEAAITLASNVDEPAILERIRTATITAAQLPAAIVLDEDLIGRLQQRLRESRFGFGRTSLGPVEPLFVGHEPQLLEQLDRIAAGDHHSILTATGFPGLDDLLDGGLRPGTLTVVASRPGAGRSTLVLNVLSHAAFTHHLPAGLFTFETTAQDVLLRVLSAQTGIDHGNLRRSSMSDTDWTHTAERMTKIAEDPLYVNAGPPPHLEALCAAVAAATAAENLALVAVDPLGAVLARTFADNREREVADVVRRLKALALQLQIAIVVTAELGRQVEHVDHRPGLNDLRDTDVIAQTADHVILLHQPDRAYRDGYQPDHAHLIVAKNRHGRRGTVPVIAQLSIARFTPVTRPVTRAALPPTPAGDAAEGDATAVAAHIGPPALRPSAAAERRRSADGASPPDGLITARGGTKTRILTVGQGSPSIVLLGRADPADDEWAALLTRLEGLTRIVRFDRPGGAVGDPFTTQIARGLGSIDAAATDLRDLLWRSKIPPPYVLVASSLGCFVADQYAVREPFKVTGTVLIDPINLVPWPVSAFARPSSGDDGEAGYLQRLSTDSFVELARFPPTQSRRTVVLSSSHGRWLRSPPAPVTEWPLDTLVEMEEVWQTFQQAWARRTKARHVIAGTAGHLVHRDQPDLVAHLVTAVVEAGRAKKALKLDPATLAANGGHLAPKVAHGEPEVDRPSRQTVT